MKNLKKYFVFLLSVLILSTSSIVSAESIDGDMSLDEEAKPFVQTKDEKLLENLKMKNIYSNLKLSNPISTNVYDPSIIYTLSVPIFQQETSYWCGPASVRETLYYINNTAPSQTKIASLLGTTTDGTDMTQISGVLNSYQSRNSYVMSSIGSQSTWAQRKMTNTKSLIPVILDIKVTASDGWLYTTNGHYIVTCGYDGRTTGSEKVQIADPHPSYYGRYWYSTNSLYSVNSAHFRQAMIW